MEGIAVLGRNWIEDRGQNKRFLKTNRKFSVASGGPVQTTMLRHGRKERENREEKTPQERRIGTKGNGSTV